MSFLIGFMGGLTVVALLALGGACGWAAHKAFARPVAQQKETLEEAERRRMEEDEQAFDILKNYSLERAYGMLDEEPRRRAAGGGNR